MKWRPGETVLEEAVPWAGDSNTLMEDKSYQTQATVSPIITLLEWRLPEKTELAFEKGDSCSHIAL